MSLSRFSKRENDFLHNDIKFSENKMMIMTLWLFVKKKKTFLINEAYHQAFLNKSKLSPIAKINNA